MTDRPTASTITDDELDALHERVLYAEAAVRRASALATRWDFTPDRKRAAAELRNELRRRTADTEPDAASDLLERLDLRQSPQTAAAAPRPDAPGTMPGARESAEHPLPGVSQRPEGEIGAQTGTQSLGSDDGSPPEQPCGMERQHPAHKAMRNRRAIQCPGNPAPPAGALRGAIASAIAKFIDDHPAGWTHSDLAGYLTDALEVGRAVLLAHAEAELRRVSALHADTERRLREELRAAVERAENAEARLQLARDTLARDGYFRPDEIGADIAPRLAEWVTHHRERAEETKQQLAEACRLLSQWAPDLMSAAPVLFRKLDALLTLSSPDAPKET